MKTTIPDGNLNQRPGEKAGRRRPRRTDPLEIFRGDHAAHLRLLESLRGAADAIRLSGFSGEAFIRLAETARLIERSVRQHEEREERVLFPILERHVQEPTRVLRVEHRELSRAIRQLTRCISDLEEGHIHASLVREMLETVAAVVKLLEDHIARENAVLFPLIRKQLTPVEYDQLGSDVTEAFAESGDHRIAPCTN